MIRVNDSRVVLAVVVCFLCVSFLPVLAQDGDEVADVPRVVIYAPYNLNTETSELPVLLNVDTEERIELPLEIDLEIFDPVVSPDGTRIAFFSRSPETGTEDIYVMLVNGENLVQITDDPALDYSPAWSPDGEQLAFITDRDGNAEIYRVNVDGTDLTRLTFTTIEEEFPAWSPDGAFIAYSTYDLETGARNVFMMTPDGEDTTQLTFRDLASAPRWSPDGEFIVFDQETEDGASEIFVITRDGEDERQVTDIGLTAYSPSWSPDGTLISFAVLNMDDNFDIFVIDVDGEALRQVTTTLEFDEYFAPWVPLPSDGKDSPLLGLFEG